MANDPIATDKDIELHDPRLYTRRAVVQGVANGSQYSKVSDENRKVLFGSEGKNVEC